VIVRPVEELHLVLFERDTIDLVFRAEAVLDLSAAAQVAHLGLHHAPPVSRCDVHDAGHPVQLVLVGDEHTDAELGGRDNHDLRASSNADCDRHP